MIDIHSHVLPGLDDGARDFAQSLAMLRLAAESGTTDIVATPHVSPAFPNEYDTRNQVFRELSQAADGIVRLHFGCDFHLTYDNLLQLLAEPEKYTINRHRYLMVELPDYVSFGPVAQALARILEEGVIPIITHPERNSSLQQNGRELAAWVSRGCLTQVTGQSLLGDFGSRARSAANRFLRDGLVHIVASDGHDLRHRPPTLAPAYEFLAARHGPSLADQLCVINPGAVIRGEALPEAIKSPSLWSKFVHLWTSVALSH